ncbi:MAG: class I SAM-dependent methyltransferase [Chlamydiae bacterium]|nr:class I SAM-dependent methyltransferase [Chlamydiota bacterium]
MTSLSANQKLSKEISDYYTHLTSSYFHYASGTYGWHYGVSDPGIKTFPEALLQSNKRLVEKLSIHSDTHILDIGCGLGGFAVWAATRFGCRVTGITLCPSHVTIAEVLAALNQVF